MALPKVRTSRANTHARRSQWKAQAAQLIAVHMPDGEVVHVPHSLVKAARKGVCGWIKALPGTCRPMASSNT